MSRRTATTRPVFASRCVPRRPSWAVWLLVGCLVLGVLGKPAAAADPSGLDIPALIADFAAGGNRSTGSPGCRRAAARIREIFQQLGAESIGTQHFSLPVMTYGRCEIQLPGGRRALLHPIYANAISPPAIPAEGWSGPLVYVGDGSLKRFNGKPVEGAVILMELASGKNWQYALDLGARALIYVDRGQAEKSLYRDKFELTPVAFPRFQMTADALERLFGDFQGRPEGVVAPEVRLFSQARWQTAGAENVFALFPGKDPKLGEQLVIVESFYDASQRVAGQAPGADQAVGIATLVQVARHLRDNPPARSVLLLATAGYGQTLAGLREAVWSFRGRTRDMRKLAKRLKATVSGCRKVIRRLSAKKAGTAASGNTAVDRLVKAAVGEEIKTRSDAISRRLMRLRLQQPEGQEALIEKLANQRLALRKLGWRDNFDDLTAAERRLFDSLVPGVLKTQKAILRAARRQVAELKSTRRLRSAVKSHELAAVVSLHLSSHGDGIGAFNRGFLYPLKPTINRVTPYSQLADVLKTGAQRVIRGDPDLEGLFHDTLRPSAMRPWQSYFIDNPPLGGEVASLAGYLGISLATTNDARPAWGTPYDLPQRVDFRYAERQSRLVCGLVGELSRAPRLATRVEPRNGFASIVGRVNFLRHGELFADQPAPGAVILAYQGPAHYLAMVDAMGKFYLRGVADKKHVLHKVIFEGFKFNPDSGVVLWSVDKKKTGKPAYRLKMQRRSMETDLVMFACRQSSLFNTLEPRSLRYMTKIQLLDGRRDAPPLRYWFSRTDTWSSTLLSLFLEDGTSWKLTLSDTVLRKKMILTNGTAKDPAGKGYSVNEYPFLRHTAFHVARDMWTLLGPRIHNLETHGIYDERIRSLQQTGLQSLENARQALAQRRYDRLSEESLTSWALASRVYDHVEKTQKDVLFGVLFYIALFVPFAFCAERLLFCYSNINKRIVAFLAILLALILVIYKVHPAFQLAYSPLVVILAFFIIGLSLMVTLIIFFRFEQEMARLQKRASRALTGEISRWKAFTASFFLGVSNLRRRRLRTALTCTTLIILTFTIMSFTTVKSQRSYMRLLFSNTVPYHGILMKTIDWRDLPPEALEIIKDTFPAGTLVAPRVWLQDEDRTRAAMVTIHSRRATSRAQGLIGLSPAELKVSGIDTIMTGGRWLKPGERSAVLLPQEMAERLGIDPRHPDGRKVTIWGVAFAVVGTFSGTKLDEFRGLDGETITPVIFPHEATAAMTEVEMDALESGDDIRSYQSRYQHIPGELTIIMDAGRLLSVGGRLKSVAVRLAPGASPRQTANELVDRFGLTLFSGEKSGTYLYQAGDTLSYSGMPNIIIPLAISVFIVLNTMIGSVYERKREIAIYTSVGLAPSHVSFLFIAESLAFAVLSVVLGYLVAQVSARFFAGTALWAGITVNYSSLAGVAAMVLVIAVVLVSVLYPSRVAAQIAIPDVNRSWTLPEAKGNTMEITLPFLMKESEYRGVAGYLIDYFLSHQDVSHGLFSTGDVHWKLDGSGDEQPRNYLEMDARVWLAPFDFGIMQHARLIIRPAADEGDGFLEIGVVLTRESGEANAWRRINRGFLHQLRRQLLIWRSLDETERAEYERIAETSPAAAGAGESMS